MNLPTQNPLITYDEIGRQLHISAARVRQIEQRALAKLRKSFAKLGIVDFRGSGSRIVERKYQHQRGGS